MVEREKMREKKEYCCWFGWTGKERERKRMREKMQFWCCRFGWREMMMMMMILYKVYYTRIK